MSAEHKFFWLTGGIVALLLLASLIGWTLGTRVTSDSGRALVDNLNARVRAWWIMVMIFAVAFLLGKATTLVLFAFVSFFALREFITLTPTRAGDRLALFLGFFVLIPVQYYSCCKFSSDEYQTCYTMLKVYTFV